LRRYSVAETQDRVASFRTHIDNRLYEVNTDFVKYSDTDMRMMAIGEIGAHFMAALLAVAAWLYLGDMSIVLKAPLSFFALMFGWKASIALVHVGYTPDEDDN
jgi:hypothetical protein